MRRFFCHKSVIVRHKSQKQLEDTNIKNIRPMFFLFLSVTCIHPCLKQSDLENHPKVTYPMQCLRLLLYVCTTQKSKLGKSYGRKAQKTYIFLVPWCDVHSSPPEIVGKSKKNASDSLQCTFFLGLKATMTKEKQKSLQTFSAIAMGMGIEKRIIRQNSQKREILSNHLNI